VHDHGRSRGAGGAGGAGLDVVRAGRLTTVQDLGRPGLAHLAVSRSGAADPVSLRLANRLAGNPEAAAGLETTLLGADVRLDGTGRWVAVTGAECDVRIDGHLVDANRAVYLAAGAVLSAGTAARGLRSYVAVAGGIHVEPVLGSRSTDVLNGIGPDPVTEGVRLPLGPVTGSPPAVDVVPGLSFPDRLRVRIIPGPRDAWFTVASLAHLVETDYEVTGESDRVGVRLAGPALERARADALPSEGMVLGSVQVPTSGRPIVFLADHPTTGGYPVVAVVHPGDLPLIAQARPGSRIAFHWARTRRRIC
jgi:biotin-dependent carboxylase-like uncharacterized protein